MRFQALFVCLILASGLVYLLFAPSQVQKREFEAMLERLAQAEKTRDRAKVAVELTTVLADTAKIRLEINFPSILQPVNSRLAAQDFDKASFLAFVDNLLYTMTEASLESHVETSQKKDNGLSKVDFSVTQLADGPSYLGGVAIDMRFIVEGTCEALVSFKAPQPVIQEARCRLEFHSVPRAGQDEKLRSPEALRHLLQ